MEKASTSRSKRKATALGAGGPKSKKTKGGKATSIDLSAATVKSKFHQASIKPPSEVLWPHMVQFSGKFAGTQREMQDLVKAHGGKIGSKAVFNLLIATPAEFLEITNKVHRADSNHTPIVHELYLYDTIIKGKQPNMEPYFLRNCVSTEEQAGRYKEDDDDEEEEEEEEPKKAVKINKTKTRLRNISPSEISTKYRKALAAPTSNVLQSYKVQFSGKFCGTQKEMHNLVLAHGGSIGTKAVFTLLIAATDEYDLETGKVLQAEIKGVPIVHETFLYDAIINGKKTPKIAKYDLSIG